ncbi:MULTISPECIES: hypothetical protein [unclassified Variovorax]|jgi:hypothetical protein|uniref:hypothetical protein n=1 Tax=unclassified Variovorax TaxID=663243 RepID=UPI000838B59D|nr:MULTISPECIES: hypothetical protein [unclassified Variovorax]PNG56590.1 hypothetical protein CHC07_03010 [Variovorax sp. B4]PNG58014.1 hypothetical protein CHC06_03013 [Variovorax sp. B2]VTV09507.1 hypothetical protein WDL1CHR_00612 [Variovorax sp. WDL1]
MASLRDMALTIEEREEGKFYWVLIEALDDEGSEILHYRRINSATTPQASYSSALALGAAALRRLAQAQPPGP